MFWTCSQVAEFWTEVFDVLNTRLQLSVSCTPELALLGIPDDVQQSKYAKLLISFLLYYVKKEIIIR